MRVLVLFAALFLVLLRCSNGSIKQTESKERAEEKKKDEPDEEEEDEEEELGKKKKKPAPAPAPAPAPKPAPAPEPAPAPAPEPAPAVPEKKVHELTPIFRSFKSDHLYSPVQAEGPNAGYADEGLAFHLVKEQIEGSTPLYRCLTAAGAHYLSTDETCEVSQPRKEGSIGNILKDPLPGTVPLKRCFSPASTDFLYVRNEAECAAAGYPVVATPVGHVPEPGFATGG